MNYYAVNGQEITEEMIDRWCASYERGDFPEGEYTVGKAVMGRPPLSSDKTATLIFKVPAGMKAAIQRKADQLGVTVSTYARSVLAQDLLRMG